MLKALMRKPHWLWLLLSLPALAFAMNGAKQDVLGDPEFVMPTMG